MAAGELLAKLQREREQLGVQTNRLDAEMRERQRQMEWQQRQQQQQQQNRPRQRQGQSRYQGGGGGGGGGGGFRMGSASSNEQSARGVVKVQIFNILSYFNTSCPPSAYLYLK